MTLTLKSMQELWDSVNKGDKPTLFMFNKELEPELKKLGIKTKIDKFGCGWGNIEKDFII